ncbi:unnamed protein product [Paramecium octaurelia]|uniref:Tetratricopeptide repeat protein n=1 Tax=Paramecium octaurelia TaxID=43137 RepID=A0A8S1XDM6_PAROT|nr:unnamed protein product [Paramecium octaurelia]
MNNPNQIDKSYVLSQLHYKKKEFPQSFKLLRQSIAQQTYKTNHALLQRVFPKSWQYQLLSKYLEEDDKFVTLPLKSILLNCLEFTLHNKFQCCITSKQKEKLFRQVINAAKQSLFRDKHLLVRKLCLLHSYFNQDYQSVIDDFLQQPRVQLKYYHQAFRFMADFLDQFEEGINLYKQYLRENPDSIEGYDCLCDLMPTLQVELWNQFITDNPNNRTGYLRLLNIQNEATVLKLFIKNNPNDLYGFEQLCLLDRDENQLDQYLLKFPGSFEAHNKKSQIAFQIKGKFNPQILSGYLNSLDIKEICQIIYSDIETYKSQNQLIKGYDLEKLKYLLSTYICNQSIVEKLDLLNSIEQKKKLIVQNEIFNEMMNIIIPKIYDINQMEQSILQNRNDIKFYIDKANYYYKLNQLDLALKVFDDYTNQFPCQFKGYDEKAQFMKYKCKPIQIKQHWEKFIQTCPNEEQNILLRKAEILTTILKQHDKAISLLDQHIKFYPGDENGYLAKIKLLHNQGRQKELLNTIDEYFQLNPQNEEIQLLKVQMLVKIYSNDVALQFIDSLPYQHSLKLVEMKAKILGEKKKEDGLKVLEEYQKCNPNCRKANKLRIQFIRDFFGNSYIQCLRELIRNDPDSIKGYKLFYKLTLDEHTLYDEARDWIDFYIETHPDQKENHKILLDMLTKRRCDTLNQG